MTNLGPSGPRTPWSPSWLRLWNCGVAYLKNSTKIHLPSINCSIFCKTLYRIQIQIRIWCFKICVLYSQKFGKISQSVCECWQLLLLIFFYMLPFSANLIRVLINICFALYVRMSDSSIKTFIIAETAIDVSILSIIVATNNVFVHIIVSVL